MKRFLMKSAGLVVGMAFLPVVLTAAASASPEGSQSAATSTVAAAAAKEPAADVPVRAMDSEGTRSAFSEVLARYPPQLGAVLKMDPSLLRNEGYLATYPELATFVKQRPEITHNPSYFLAGVEIAGDYKPEPPAVRAFNNAVESFTIFCSLLLLAFVVTWLIRTLIEHRRWSRVSRTQTEVHNKLLDRFTANEDLLAYVQTNAGKRFLESAPIQVQEQSAPISSPLNRVFWPVQAGVVLSAIGIGFALVSSWAHQDVAPGVMSIGIVALSAGVGLIASGAIGYVLSRKLRLLASSEEPTQQA